MSLLRLRATSNCFPHPYEPYTKCLGTLTCCSSAYSRRPAQFYPSYLRQRQLIRPPSPLRMPSCPGIVTSSSTDALPQTPWNWEQDLPGFWCHLSYTLYVTYTCYAWAGGTCESFPDFAIIVSFMLFTVFTLANVLYFEEFLIHNSRGFMILKNNWISADSWG